MLRRAGAGGEDVDLAAGDNSAIAAGVAVTGAGFGVWRMVTVTHGQLGGGPSEQTPPSERAPSCSGRDMLNVTIAGGADRRQWLSRVGPELIGAASRLLL